MDWQSMVDLEPMLGVLADDIESGRQTMTTIMVGSRLTPQVGVHCRHPRLLIDEAYDKWHGCLLSGCPPMILPVQRTPFIFLRKASYTARGLE